MGPDPSWRQSFARWRQEFEDRLPARLRRLILDVPVRTALRATMTRWIGRYSPPTRTGGHRITLSPFLTPAEAREAFGHELAHFVEYLAWPPPPGAPHHGGRWRYVMDLFRLPPRAGRTMALSRRRERFMASISRKRPLTGASR
jgi:hypothetical protein